MTNFNKVNFTTPASVTGLVTTKGDLITTSTGTGLTRLGVGTNGQFLTANSAQATGLEWTSSSVTLTDSTNPFIDNVDATKRAFFQCSSITTATDRTYTFPDITSTLLTDTSTATVTNKSISDSTCPIVDNADATKRAFIQCSGITTATDRTYTLLNETVTLAAVRDQGFNVKKSGNQTITTATNTIITSWAITTPQNHNTGSNFDLTTGVYTAPATGKYSVSGQIDYQGSATGTRQIRIDVISVGPVTTSYTLGLYVPLDSNAPVMNGSINELLLSTGDTVTLVARQTSGGDLTVQATQTYFAITRNS